AEDRLSVRGFEVAYRISQCLDHLAVRPRQQADRPVRPEDASFGPEPSEGSPYIGNQVLGRPLSWDGLGDHAGELAHDVWQVAEWSHRELPLVVSRPVGDPRLGHVIDDE